ncbi:MAG: ATP synthase F1 subunit epsilon [Lachnospiraceae bacterium]|nr:ATP synthase F1 subunit epsilon [Lachnospiraceae bacterium]
MAEEKMFRLKIITPDRIFYEGEADMVEMSTSNGDVGIYKNHVPTTLILIPGVLSIHQDGEMKEAALHSGFAEILLDQVTILAEAAEWPDEIDVERARRARERAEERIQSHASDVDVARAQLALRRSLVRMKVGH